MLGRQAAGEREGVEAGTQSIWALSRELQLPFPTRAFVLARRPSASASARGRRGARLGREAAPAPWVAGRDPRRCSKSARPSLHLPSGRRRLNPRVEAPRTASFQPHAAPQNRTSLSAAVRPGARGSSLRPSWPPGPESEPRPPPSRPPLRLTPAPRFPWDLGPVPISWAAVPGSLPPSPRASLLQVPPWDQQQERLPNLVAVQTLRPAQTD